MTRHYAGFTGSKYKSRKTHRNGLLFDSKREADRYTKLLLMLRSGRITALKTQVTFELLPKQKNERAVKYIADFVYEQDGEVVVEDCKGVRTRDYIIKRKLMLWVHGISVKEV